LALFLSNEGFNQSQIARVTGIPRSTIRYWLTGGYGQGPRRHIDPAGVPPREYAYLLGLYLGDGHIARMPRTYRLDIAQDTRYPGIIQEACHAMGTVLAPNKVGLRKYRDENAVAIYAYSNSLPVLFPQHGPGRKHERPIVLEDWQRDIVDRHPCSASSTRSTSRRRCRSPARRASRASTDSSARRPDTPVARVGIFLQSR